ncbi:hypothetical protein CDD81_347 [Ophiocordyceps australis]|uniref:AA1-like domain-containing protein n=1 Tax=Ophiocordyceps australis TaxID=1399860 RepID=A0A2C5X8M1_9HYPO|nr:hypothetical protein CDD81_347 [Ophiocordyceps australis]
MKITAAFLVALSALAAASPVMNVQNDADMSTASGPEDQVTVRLRRRFEYTQKMDLIAGSCPKHTSPIPWSDNAKEWYGDEQYISYAEFNTTCHPSVVVHQRWLSANITLAEGEKCPKGMFPSKWHLGAMPAPTGWKTNPRIFTFTVFCNTTEDTESPYKSHFVY